MFVAVETAHVASLIEAAFERVKIAFRFLQ
jgi:hypothetical protein